MLPYDYLVVATGAVGFRLHIIGCVLMATLKTTCSLRIT